MHEKKKKRKETKSSDMEIMNWNNIQKKSFKNWYQIILAKKKRNGNIIVLWISFEYSSNIHDISCATEIIKEKIAK